MTDLENDLLGKLNGSGIAVTSVDRFLDETEEFHELSLAVSRLVESKKDDLAMFRAQAHDANAIGSKTFNLEMLGGELEFDAQNVFARFALNESILRIADAYFGMRVKLRYYNVWQTLASNCKSRESQLWHFDREDNYILKVFLYLDDVDEGAGPFTYAPGTHRKGRHFLIEPDYFLEGGVRRTTDDQMKAAFPKNRWISAEGKKGTIVFADTRGYHKGGEARTKDRLMFTCMFTSQASESKNLIRFPVDFDASSLSDRQRRALQF